MEIIHDTLEIVILIISSLGAVVVAWGVIEAIKAFVLIKFKPGVKDAVSASEAIGILSIIVVIRTILSYFLRMELRQGDH